MARRGGLRLLVTVTFNPNQLRAHLLPLIALDEVESITLVSDVVPPPLPKVRAVLPSLRARRLATRAGAKLALCSRLARTERFDWVMGFNFVPHGFTAQLVGRRCGTRSLYHMIGGEREWLGGGYLSGNRVLSKLPRPVRLVERAMLAQMRNATLVGTMGPLARERVIREGLDPARVVVIPPSTDVERFRPRTDGERKYAVVTVAALIGGKRVADFLQAAAIVLHRHPGARFAVAGDGPLRGRLERQAQQLGIGRHVDFLGHVDRVEDVYGAARAFTLTSDGEGLPIGVLDAMATGLPVVASRVGEVETAVRDGETGFLYAVGDVPRLAERLNAILDDESLAGSLGRAARDDAVARYSIEAVSEVYRELLLR